MWEEAEALTVLEASLGAWLRPQPSSPQRVWAALFSVVGVVPAQAEVQQPGLELAHSPATEPAAAAVLKVVAAQQVAPAESS